MIAKTKTSRVSAKSSKQFLKKFNEVTKSPLDFLVEQKTLAAKSITLTKTLFDHAKSSGEHFKSNSVPDELYVDRMDDEQIWQQIELQNDSFWEKCFKDTCRLLSLNEEKLLLNIRAEGDGNEEAESDNGSDDENELENRDFENDEDFDENADDDEEEEDVNEDDDDDENYAESDDEDGGKKKKSRANKAIASAVNDEFFDLDEMEAFLDGEDRKEFDKMNGKSGEDEDDEDSDEEEIDYFEDLSDEDDEEDEARNLKYTDYFKAEKNKKRIESVDDARKARREMLDEKNKRKSQQLKEDLDIDDEEIDDEGEEIDEDFDDEENELDDDGEFEAEKAEASPPEEKSEFENRQNRLQRRIEELENQAVEPKQWQLKGEIDSTSRPKNSLLEEVLDFDTTSRPAPLITEETTLRLQDIIIRRIKSKAWDDVERKIKPIDDRDDFRKKLVLDQEKSKESLAQIYEKDYLEKLNKMNGLDSDAAKKDEPPEHTEIRKAMKDLFLKLDALSNFHFTAKPPTAEPKIITNVPAINMEEVAPIGVSDAQMLAPEEVKEHPKGDEIGKSERTDSDKKRERRQKKFNQKLKAKANERKIAEKEKLGIKVNDKEKQQQLMSKLMKNRNVIKTANTKNGELAPKSSKAFFEKLQDNAATSGKSKAGNKKKSSLDLSRNETNAKRLKL